MIMTASPGELKFSLEIDADGSEPTYHTFQILSICNSRGCRFSIRCLSIPRFLMRKPARPALERRTNVNCFLKVPHTMVSPNNYRNARKKRSSCQLDCSFLSTFPLKWPKDMPLSQRILLHKSRAIRQPVNHPRGFTNKFCMAARFPHLEACLLPGQHKNPPSLLHCRMLLQHNFVRTRALLLPSAGWSLHLRQQHGQHQRPLHEQSLQGLRPHPKKRRRHRLENAGHPLITVHSSPVCCISDTPMAENLCH